MKVSVITVAYKNSKIVIDLLNSIQKFNDIGDELEVIIVDNSPEDCRIDKAISVAEYKNYKYIPADNKGFGAGNNIGAAVAKGDILAFLNPDIILVEPIFQTIITKFENNKQLAWLGGQMLQSNGKKNHSFGYHFEYEPTTVFEFLKFFFEKKFGLFNGSKMYLTGADIIIRRDIFEKVGKFDDNIFMYNEESDLAQRIFKQYPGKKIMFSPDIRMIHLEGKSTVKMSKENLCNGIDSTIYYCRKYGIDYEKIFYRHYVFGKLKLKIKQAISYYSVGMQKEYLKLLEEYFPAFVSK